MLYTDKPKTPMMIKGVALISHKMKNRERVYMGGIEKYEGQLLDVIDRNSSGDVLVITKDNLGIGDVLAEDVFFFLPLVKEKGIIIPVELQGTDKIIWLATAIEFGIEKFNVKYISKCIAEQRVSTKLDFLS
jgi:hypothetical protein